MVHIRRHPIISIALVAGVAAIGVAVFKHHRAADPDAKPARRRWFGRWVWRPSKLIFNFLISRIAAESMAAVPPEAGVATGETQTTVP